MAGWAKRLGFGLVGLAALVAVTLTILAARTRLPGEELTPAGVRRNTSQYVKMRDAVPIALVSPVLRHWAQRCYFFRYPAHISLLCPDETVDHLHTSDKWATFRWRSP
jgi:hypothetical protein